MIVKWRQLFDYVENRLEYDRKCSGTHKHVKEFCFTHNIDYDVINKKLVETGGDCDCKVIMNNQYKIDERNFVDEKYSFKSKNDNTKTIKIEKEGCDKK